MAKVILDCILYEIFLNADFILGHGCSRPRHFKWDYNSINFIFCYCRLRPRHFMWFFVNINFIFDCGHSKPCYIMWILANIEIIFDPVQTRPHNLCEFFDNIGFISRWPTSENRASVPAFSRNVSLNSCLAGLAEWKSWPEN